MNTRNMDDERDQFDAEWAHQQGLDEQADLLSIEEQREQMLWRLSNSIRDAVKFCGIEDVERVVHETIDDIYCDSPK